MAGAGNIENSQLVARLEQVHISVFRELNRLFVKIVIAASCDFIPKRIVEDWRSNTTCNCKLWVSQTVKPFCHGLQDKHCHSLKYHHNAAIHSFIHLFVSSPFAKNLYGTLYIWNSKMVGRTVYISNVRTLVIQLSIFHVVTLLSSREH